MKTNSLTVSPRLLPEPLLAVHTTKHNRERREIIQLPLVSPPDAKRIKELNALAAKPPFCHHFRARKHDML
ncbi:hypothetical protein ACX0G9_24350 [Flavitalea flava]